QCSASSLLTSTQASRQFPTQLRVSETRPGFLHSRTHYRIRLETSGRSPIQMLRLSSTRFVSRLSTNCPRPAFARIIRWDSTTSCLRNDSSCRKKSDDRTPEQLPTRLPTPPNGTGDSAT